MKFFKNYSPEDYMLHHQNWCITQDQRGIIYIGNHGNLMEYDSVSWRHISIPNESVRSLAVDRSGTIYVGGVNDFGFLAPGSYGQMKYISLLEYVDEKVRNFSHVWRAHVTGEGIFFRTSRYVFCWNPEKKQMVVELESGEGDEFRFNGSFDCMGKLFIKQRKIGILQKKGNSYKLIPGSEIFAPIGVVFMIVPFDTSGEKLLIGTREMGFFIYDGKSLEQFSTEVEHYLKEKKATHGIKLSQSPGHIAIATLRGGVVVTDLQGRLKYLFTKETGLLDNNVKYVFEDAQGNLWAALNTGIAKIEYSSPLSVYNDEHSHLPGVVYSVTRQTGRLYSGTSEGLFYLVQNGKIFFCSLFTQHLFLCKIAP
ncbi:MAG: hypothetical protein KAT34_00810 [Candidatus Aminicenantes bacterium]|nr:hypothetical protein [Candidatus Aminicenantes bacterium]